MTLFRSQEQRVLSTAITQHIANPVAPLLVEGGTGLGKTRAYLAAIASTTKRIAIAVPSHLLLDQLLASKCLAATGVEVVPFRPSRMFESRAEYEAQREAVREARVMLCTAASVIIDQRLRGEYNGSTERDVIIFDEADQLPDMAALQSDAMIPANLIAGEKLEVALTRLSSYKADPEIRAAARLMLEIKAEAPRYAEVGLDDEGNAVLWHRLPGRMLKKISNRASTVFVSATLSHAGDFRHFKHAMGISEVSPLSMIADPVKHGAVDFEFHDLDVNGDGWLTAVKLAIREAPKPCLVVTASHELTASLDEGLEGVTIKAGAWAGLDLPGLASVIVPRVPYGNPVVVDGEIVTHYLDALVTATRRMKQAMGRGMRGPDARFKFIVMDGRAKRLRFVPDRFQAAWSARRTFDEGARREVVLSKAERDPMLRKAALKAHGEVCCDCGISGLHRLEVHHLNPIAEGARRTTVQDVVVVCRNCHSDRHLEMRMDKAAA